jgi:hypothetical protein
MKWPWKKCKHRWKVLTKEVAPSGIEQLTPGTRLRGSEISGVDLVSRSALIVLQCEKCTKLKIINKKIGEE